jgi:hypothetical protein
LNRPHLIRRAPQRSRGLIHRCALPTPGMQSRSTGTDRSVPKSLRCSDIGGLTFLCRRQVCTESEGRGKRSFVAPSSCWVVKLPAVDACRRGTADSGANQKAETLPFCDLSLVLQPPFRRRPEILIAARARSYHVAQCAIVVPFDMFQHGCHEGSLLS